MKKFILLFFTLFCLTSINATTYYWVGGTIATNRMNDRVNWSTVGVGGAAVGIAGINITFTSADILIIDGNDVSSAVGLQTGAITGDHPSSTTINIAQLILMNGADFKINGSANRNININGAAGNDLDVPAGCTLRFDENSSNGIINLLTGTNGSIYGNVYLIGGSTSIRSVDVNGLIFYANSFCYSSVSNGCFGTTGSGTANSVTFQARSTFVHVSGGNPFQLAQPASFVVFNTGSLYKLTAAAVALSIAGRTYANLEYAGSGISSSSSSTGPLSIDTLTVTSGTGNIDVTGNAFNIKGNISVASGATLGLIPSSSATVTLSGTVQQNVSNAGTFTFGANQNVVISNNSTNGVILNSAFTVPGTITINNATVLATTATLSASGGVTANGTFKIKQGGYATGTFTYAGSGSTLYYDLSNASGSYYGAGSTSSHSFWPFSNQPYNVTVINTIAGGGVDIDNITRNIQGIFTLGGKIINNCNLTFSGSVVLNANYEFGSACGTFLYPCTSTLTYNTGYAVFRGAEWTGAVTPGNLMITGNTEVRNSGTTNAIICGSLTIDAGSKLYMDYAGANGDLSVGKNVNLSGNLSLGTSTGDLYIGGNWTHNSGTFTDHAHAVFFNGSIAQTITNTIAASNNTETFTYLVINNTHASGVNLATGTDVIVSGSTGDVLQLINSGPLNLNGDTLTLSNLGGNILVTGATRTITGIAGSTLIVNGYDITNVAKTVTSSTSGKLLTDINVKIQLTGGIDFGSFLSTINGTLQINTNGYVKLNAPVYGNTSFLIYYNGALGYKRNYEWSAVGAGTIGTTPGYPNKVIVDNNTPVDIGDASVTSGQNFRACADSLTIRSGSSLTMNNMAFNLTVGTDLNIYGTLVLSSVANGDLFVGRSWKRTGTFTQNGRNVTFNGTADGTLTATGGQLFSNVYLDKSASTKKITLQDNVDIGNELGLTRGTIDLADKNITFLSTATSTARLAPVITPANIGLNYTSTGRFVVQRYIPAKRAWRLLTAPFSEITQTISEAWQEGGQTTALTPYPAVISNPAPTYGTHVTGGLANNGNVVKGFDAGPNSTSIYAHDNATNSWNKAPSGTKLVNIDSARGWMLFVRGDRTTNLSLATSAVTTPTTLRTKGKLHIGSKVTSSLPAGFSVIGNPYASAISFDNVVKTNINNSYYLWDANVAGAFNVGGWVTFAYLSPGVYTRTINSGNGSTNIDSNGVIQSGAAFMVYSTAGSGSITINESDKKTGSNINQYRPVRNAVTKNQLRTSLFTFENGTGNRLINDGNVINFDAAFCNCIDTWDAVKPANFAENFGIMSGGQKIAIERKGLIHQGDTIQFDMWKMKVNQYQLEFAPDKLTVPNGTAAFLEDNYRNSKTPVHLNDTTRINFSITSDAASAVSDRFRLLFVPSVVFTAITANKQHRAVKVGWEVSAELNIREYDIERSVDGIHFSTIGTVTGNGDSDVPVAYHWQDDMPVRSGNLFYRIRSISNNDIVVYSDVARVKNTRNDIFVNDENIKTTDVSIAERNKMQSVMLEPGKYRLKIFSANGQLLGTDNINWSSKSSIQIIVAQQHLSRGLYLLEIFDKNKLKAAVKVFAE